MSEFVEIKDNKVDAGKIFTRAQLKSWTHE